MVLAALLLAAASTVAPAVDLQWSAPAGCPDASHVEARLAAYLGDDHEAAEPTRVQADVARLDDGRWELRLRFEDDAGRPPRVLTNASCEGLAEAAVVVVVIAVAPEAMTRSRGSDPPKLDAPPIATDSQPVRDDGHGSAVAPAATQAPQPAPAVRSAPVGVSLGVLAGVGFGTVPIGFVLEPSVAVTGKHWRVDIAATYASPRSLYFDDLPTSGSSVTQWAIGPNGCGLIRVRAFLTIPMCLGLELGELIAEPVKLRNGRTQRSLWAAALAAIALRFTVHRRVALWLEPVAVISLRPTKVTAAGDPNPLFRTAPVGMRALAGLEVLVW